MTDQAFQNIDREIWRQDLQDPLDPDNFYAPSVHVTAGNGIGINVGGTVVVMTPEAWVNLYLSANPPRAEAPVLS